MRDRAGSGVDFVEIGEHDNGEAVVGIARDLGCESLPCAAVLDAFVIFLLSDEPPKSVARWIRLTISEGISARYGRDSIG